MKGGHDRIDRGGRADYGRLAAVLSARTGPVVTLSWAELDSIVGGLPRSAVDHNPQWWHGDRSHTRAWRAAGFELDRVEVNRWVTFRRSSAAIPTSSAPGPAARSTPLASATTNVSVDVLRGVEPRTALLILQCSATKRGGGEPAEASVVAWPSTLVHARTSVLRAAGLDDSRLLPGWQRYNGTFYRHAHRALTEAVTNGRVVIISGGYGLVRADELVGTYDKILRLGDWPRGLLETLLVDEARRTASATVVAFTSTTTDYAQLIRRTRWQGAGVTALLVTVTGVSGGAMVEVPRRLGQAFTAFWDRRHDRYPAGTSVQRLA